MSAEFAEAKAAAPAILFIDGFDGIGKRGSSGEWASTIVNRLLVLLDGVTKTKDVIVVAATSAPHAIDEAFLSSGRMETHVELAPRTPMHSSGYSPIT